MSCSISMARQSIEHLIALHERDGSLHEVCDQARQGAKVLAWLDKRQDIMRAIDALEKEQPELAEIFRAFPGARIVGIK